MSACAYFPGLMPENSFFSFSRDHDLQRIVSSVRTILLRSCIQGGMLPLLAWLASLRQSSPHVPHVERPTPKKYSMFSFSQPINPVLRAHLDSQLTFFNDLSNSMSGSFQNVCLANGKLGQDMLEETLNTGQRMLATQNPTDVLAAASSGAQPAADKLLAYRQHLSSLAADAQIDVARLTQQHGQEASRTAHAWSDEVTRVTAEATDRNMRQHEEALKSARDPFRHVSTQRTEDSAQADTNPAAMASTAGASMDAQSQAGPASVDADIQAPAAQPSRQPGERNTRKPG